MAFSLNSTREDRPVLATLRAAWSPSLSERFVVILKDQAADVALAPVVVDLNGVHAIAERVDPRVERWQHPHSPTLGRLRTPRRCAGSHSVRIEAQSSESAR
jgi:hypothetical protein